jgi:hypothetical protein
MSDSEIVADKRFRLAIHKREYSRAITLYFKIKFPCAEHLERLPSIEISQAKKYVDNAFSEKFHLETNLDREMR